jgi:hypothetical protein
MYHQNITQIIEERIQESKNSVKTYQRHEKAEEMGRELAQAFEQWNNTKVGVRYIVTYLPNRQRWTVIFDLSNWSAKSKQGTYLGWFAQKGFFSI